MKKNFTFKDANILINEICSILDELSYPSKNLDLILKQTRKVYYNLYKSSYFSSCAENEILGKETLYSNDEKFEELLVLLDLYLLNKKCAHLCNGIISRINSDTQVKLLDLRVVKNSFKWFFTSKQKKEKAINAYDYLIKYNTLNSFIDAKKAIDYFKNLDIQNKERALKRFENEKETYENLIKEIVGIPNIEKKLTIFEDLWRICNLSKSRINKIKEYKKIAEKQVVESINCYSIELLMSDFSLMPIDDLKKIQKGLRLKPLKDNGYMTIKDLLLADEYDLSSIPGISESGAEFYKFVATETALFFKGRFHIILSPKVKNDYTNHLVCSVYGYMLITFVIDKIMSLDKEYTPYILSYKAIVDRIGNGEFWPFYSNDYKKEIITKYNELNEIIKNKYAPIIKTKKINLDAKLISNDIQLAWNNFEKHEDNFYQIIDSFWNKTNKNDEENLYKLIDEYYGFYPSDINYNIVPDRINDGIKTIEEKEKQSNSKDKVIVGSFVKTLLVENKKLEKSNFIKRCSVTKRVNDVTQPRGGYIKTKDMEKIIKKNTKELSPMENVHPSLIGLAVDYLTRFMVENNPKKAFEISLIGANNVDEYNKALGMVSGVSGLDDKSIINAIKLSGYDSAYRAGIHAYKPVDDINPDQSTIENVRIMVERSLDFFKEYGPIVKSGITFEGGYSSVIVSGDADFITKDTLWDFKVSKNPPTSKQTLQLLIYYLMGLRSDYEKFKELKFLGIYNPRLNTIYRYEISLLSKDIIEVVEKEVICY